MTSRFRSIALAAAAAGLLAGCASMSGGAGAVADLVPTAAITPNPTVGKVTCRRTPSTASTSTKRATAATTAMRPAATSTRPVACTASSPPPAATRASCPA